MSTEYSHNISMLVPEAQWAAAGAVIAIISGQQSDLLQFGSAKFLPDFDACNAQAKASHVAVLQAAAAGQFVPQRPEWDTDEQIDMQAVQDLISTMQCITTIPEDGISPSPGAVIIGLDIDASTLAAACGLVKIKGD
jgi:hypothetical protein